jgi:hypothetical protein
MFVFHDTHVHLRQASSNVDGTEVFDGEVLSDDSYVLARELLRCTSYDLNIRKSV